MSTENWLDVAAVDEIPPGEFEIVETDDFVVAVFNVDGEFHAIEDICTHDGEELTGGPVDGDQIVCPRHGARFCLRTGKALTPPAYEDLPTFPVRILDGRVQVAVE
ncbi:MAG: non-heme iron oxygenase ferredoxin subunit [Gammaproteobacteria bacterium]|nr:MAG: non-heme iron oxygenase ferredoxin subunit [Gammaproteobacteria bacterium]